MVKLIWLRLVVEYNQMYTSNAMIVSSPQGNLSILMCGHALMLAHGPLARGSIVPLRRSQQGRNFHLKLTAGGVGGVGGGGYHGEYSRKRVKRSRDRGAHVDPYEVQILDKNIEL